MENRNHHLLKHFRDNLSKIFYRLFQNYGLGLLLFLLLSTKVAICQSAPILSFNISDQFGDVHTEKDYRGFITIIIGSDRGGSRYNSTWIKAIGDLLGNNFDNTRIKFLQVADVSSVPFFLKGFVKSKFPEARKEWILLDWKGYFPETYQFVDDSCNIVIINKTGEVSYKTNGQKLDNQKLTTICDNIIELLKISR